MLGKLGFDFTTSISQYFLKFLVFSFCAEWPVLRRKVPFKFLHLFVHFAKAELPSFLPLLFSTVLATYRPRGSHFLCGTCYQTG